MRYKIGDVAKILGISPDLLRYYEKKGVVKPTKDPDNDYRYYDAWDVNFLMDCLWFKNFGFSIEQIAEMVRIPSARQLSTLFYEKEDELRATITRCELLLKRSEEHRQELTHIPRLLGRCELGDSPEVIRYINRYTDSFDNSPALQRLSRDWLDLIPFTSRCFEIQKEDLLQDGGRDYRWGLALAMDYAEQLKVAQDPPVAHLRSERSIHSVFKSSGKGNFSPRHIRYMVDYAHEQGLTITGGARGQLLASVLEGDLLTGYFEVWLPIAEKPYDT
ncbi:MAG: MerR family transcriptional regulator [Oscillospiraceae bacterium]|nr:MerR family transcriptional regulator [Oscillospiraceae bacterium]